MKRFLLSFMLFTVFVYFGCAQSDESVIKKTVIEYNKNLAIALQSDVKVMKDVATEMEQGRIEIFMTQMADEHKIVDAELNKLNFKSVKILDNQEWQDLIKQYMQKHEQDMRIPGAGDLKMYKSGALVQTDETWTYRYLDIDDRSQSSAPSLLGYNVTYILVKEKNKWKVTDLWFEEKNTK